MRPWSARPQGAALLSQCCAAFAATPRRVLQPHVPDHLLLSSIVDAGLPRARATVGHAVVHRLQALPSPVTVVPAHDLEAALRWIPAKPRA